MITNKEKWDNYVNKNKDPYGKCCVDIARQVMKNLDEVEDFEPHDLIIKSEKEIGEDGITGFMAGAIAAMVAQCHSRGKEWNEKWNKDNGGSGKEKGTINPAILEVKN
jgi:hypothetical protein